VELIKFTDKKSWVLEPTLGLVALLADFR